ncbi:sulfotransferase domain-containing protein [Anabaena sp. UHCC 0451]|uniref:sulfotransferase domain-containing protein n=1 Tax=Anabaena sp. UHCC 0451 TaxID=2055235 RepID=UPI002B20D358|nr:sulfotransferase domain-containing protein [Anabaena sp. UHCC 0451]MEA5575026.1 sulfotransferase domain-containing protein [Anabaena sp. UHCC 0451]
MIKALKGLNKILDATIQRNLLAAQKKYIPLQSDLFIVEFPKSGVTWLTNILANVELLTTSDISPSFQCGKPISFGNRESFISDIHVGYPSNYYSHIFGGKLIKSHAKMTSDIQRLIYLYRHPVSVMKSYYRMCKGYQTISNQITFSEFVRDSNMGVEAWKQHIRSWLFDSRVSQRIFFVSYENLVDNTSLYIEQIYQFFGIYALPQHIIEEAIQISSYENMKILETNRREIDLRFKWRFDNNYKFIKGSTEENLDNEQEAVEYIRLQCLEELRWLGYES